MATGQPPRLMPPRGSSTSVARRTFEPQPYPEHYSREMFEEPEVLRFRRIAPEDSEGRGNSWQLANQHGWDGDCAIVYARDCGGWRTLSPLLWEFK